MGGTISHIVPLVIISNFNSAKLVAKSIKRFKRECDAFKVIALLYKGTAKRSVTNRLPKFYPRYILKCFAALEWCIE